ncbi:MAG TPA: hypothetical protein VLH84_02220 [Patescibacteria group bacterium]|nr:hypothetical protein [Patescibacteria group bacterium]
MKTDQPEESKATKITVTGAKAPAVKPSRPAPRPAGGRVMDVMRPGKAAASPTSRPIIVGHKPAAQSVQAAVSGVGERDREEVLESHKKLVVKAAPEPKEVIAPKETAPEPTPEPEQHEEPEPATAPAEEPKDAVPADAEAEVDPTIDVEPDEPAEPEPVEPPVPALTPEPDPAVQKLANPKIPRPETPAAEPEPEADAPPDPAKAEFNKDKLDELAATAPEPTPASVPAEPAKEPPAADVAATHAAEPLIPQAPPANVKPLTPAELAAASAEVADMHIPHDGTIVVDPISLKHHALRTLVLVILIIALALVVLDILLDAAVITINSAPHTHFFGS